MLQTAKTPATAGMPSANNSRDTNNGRNLSDIRYVISSRTPVTAKTSTIAWMIEIEGAPATVAMPTAEGTTIRLETSGTGRMSATAGPRNTEMPTTVVTRNFNSRRNTNGGSRHKGL
jgi:hypothetical protein